MPWATMGCGFATCEYLMTTLRLTRRNFNPSNKKRLSSCASSRSAVLMEVLNAHLNTLPGREGMSELAPLACQWWTQPHSRNGIIDLLCMLPDQCWSKFMVLLAQKKVDVPYQLQDTEWVSLYNRLTQRRSEIREGLLNDVAQPAPPVLQQRTSHAFELTVTGRFKQVHDMTAKSSTARSSTKSKLHSHQRKGIPSGHDESLRAQVLVRSASRRSSTTIPAKRTKTVHNTLHLGRAEELASEQLGEVAGHTPGMDRIWCRHSASDGSGSQPTPTPSRSTSPYEYSHFADDQTSWNSQWSLSSTAAVNTCHGVPEKALMTEYDVSPLSAPRMSSQELKGQQACSPRYILPESSWDHVLRLLELWYRGLDDGERKRLKDSLFQRERQGHAATQALLQTPPTVNVTLSTSALYTAPSIRLSEPHLASQGRTGPSVADSSGADRTVDASYRDITEIVTPPPHSRTLASRLSSTLEDNDGHQPSLLGQAGHTLDPAPPPQVIVLSERTLDQAGADTLPLKKCPPRKRKVDGLAKVGMAPAVPDSSVATRKRKADGLGKVGTVPAAPDSSVATRTRAKRRRV
ncbi:hypothetical protein DFP72DRAFT_1177088 [Ephemerocybe angulata]|uniref:Uncharacterized protein n=1 Tax=Ephemerocybe angulata TaxID=980116 RepID=A0A8H6LUI8_9AGAR|nr:hypothetical protein DFP72DRAFT_1177088 [Tulosesus angulatus]